MTTNNILNTTTSNMRTTVKDFRVLPMMTDGVGTGQNFWDNKHFTKWYGYYKKIPELHTAINAFATWVLGKGYSCDLGTETRLSYISGAGEDTFNSILWNLLVTKKFNGDAYAECMYKDDELINIKPLDPSRCKTHFDDKGIITHYTYLQPNGEENKINRDKMLHLMNDRVADEMHGSSIIEACEWVILARNEAMSDWRRISHRSTIRVMFIDADNRTKIQEVKNQYADAIKNGELLIVPAKKPDAEFEDLILPNHEAFLSWVRYLENFFYQALGVPKVILGGSEEFTEASAKIGYLTFEQVYTKEVEELEQDLWNQLGILVKFNKPVSLKNETLNSEDKNTGQTGFQGNDATIGSGKA